MNDRSTLLFAHANGFTGGCYRRFLAPFQHHYHVKAIDRLAHDPRYPVDAHWHSLSLEMEAEIERCATPVVAVGHSMGGVLMCKVASRRPELFRALIMLDPPLINGRGAWGFNLLRWLGQVDRVTPAGKSRGRLAHWDSPEQARSYFLSRALFRRFDPACLDDYLADALEPDTDRGGLRLRFQVETEVAIFRTTPGDMNRLPRLRVPGAVISGEESPVPFLPSARRHARRHGMRHLMAPGGHMFPLEHPAEAADIVLEALAQLDSAATPGGKGATANANAAIKVEQS